MVKIKSTVIDADKGFDRLGHLLSKTSKAVDVGYWAGEVFEENGADLALVAYANEYGVGSQSSSVSGNKLLQASRGSSLGRRMNFIPARSFMRSTYDENIDKLMSLYEKFLSQDLKARSNKALIKLGAAFTTMVKKKIKSAASWAVPNAPSTIKKKGSNKPLFDKGNLLNKIDFKEVG